MARQLNLICVLCYYGADGGAICASGYEPSIRCQHFKQQYTCKGGMAYDTPVTEEMCRECAKVCRGCIKMQAAYGFVNIEKVRHLLRSELNDQT